MAAIDDLDGLLSPLPGFDILTSMMKQTALDTALIPDSFGIWPGQVGYETTYDVYWAAVSLIHFLQAQPVIRQTSSEGTSIAVDAPNWSGLISYYKSNSKIANYNSSQAGVIQSVPIPDVPHVRRTDMSGRWDNGDVDTDLG